MNKLNLFNNSNNNKERKKEIYRKYQIINKS